MNLKELHSFKMSDAVKFHDQLNPKLFHGQHLDSTVRKKLLVIAEDFLNELGISDFKVKDITVSGSNAAYSYTPHSDIDLHLIVDMDQFTKDKVYQELFNAKKTVYNDTHDIKIKGIPVELYVQPASDPHVSLGEYSILNDHWIKFPLKRRANFDQNNTKAKYEQLKSLCVRALKELDLKKVNRVIKKIKQYRKAGLANFGEFGPENLAYKMIKNQGYLQKLFDLRNKLHSAKLSFETMHQNPKDINETIGPHQGKELKLMLHSSKPAAIIDSSNLPLWEKAIKENNWTVQQIDITKIPSKYPWANSDPITIVSKDPETANHIKKLMFTTLGGPSPAPESYHIQLGRLLGYSEEDITHFLNKQGYKKSDQISEEPVPEKKARTLYHVTLTSNLPQIHEKGITQFNSSNWLKAGTKERYGEGEIYAFDNINDARAWAGKMDWTKNKKIGSGNISIVNFTDDGEWEEDPAPLVAVRGHALKKHGKVSSKNILDVEPFTQAMIRNLTTKNSVTEEITTLQKMYGNNLPDRSEIFWNYVSGNDLKKPLEIKTMSKHSVMHHLLGQYRVEHIDDLMDMLDDDQVETIAQYMADPKLSDNIVVVDNNKIIDGNHRALAAALKGVPIKYVEMTDTIEEASDITPYSSPKFGINVRSDSDIDYADLIVDGKKKYESRNTDSLRPYVGKTVGIIRTGSGPAVVIGQATIGEPIVADEKKFNKLRKKHLVPKGSKFDINSNGTKYLYPIIDPIRWDDEKLVKQKGIVARKIEEQDVAKALNIPSIKAYVGVQGVAEGLDQDLPSVLYHATYKPRLKSIKLKGLGAGGKRNWEDSQRGVVYLALDPNVAESYAETSDMVPEEWLDQIVILKISTAGLDPNKFGIDSNVQDNSGDTVEYHGVIPVSNISLYKQGVAEDWNKVTPIQELERYANDPTIFISYTVLPKLGINPNPNSSETPGGVYAYPLSMVYDDIKNDITNVPFYKSSVKYIMVFKYSGKILSTDNFSESDFKSAITRLHGWFGKILHQPNVPFHTDDYNMGYESPFNALLEYTKTLALKKLKIPPNNIKFSYDSNEKIIPPIVRPPEYVFTWNTLVKKATGYDAFISTKGTIHGGEPIQAMFLSPEKLHVISMITIPEAKKQGVAEGLEQSLSSMVSQDQAERNEYQQFVKSQAGGDWTKGAKMYAQLKKRPANDIFDDGSRLNQFMKMTFNFDKFTDEDWDNYWLLAQHCDDNRDFQKQALATIKKYQGVDHSHYKYLYDRISVGLTGKQKYGTQNIQEGVAEGQGEQISKTKALNILRKELMNSYEYMKCANLEEFKHRLQWLSEGMLKNHMTGGKSTVINSEEIKLYQEYRKKREQIQRGLTQGVAEASGYIPNAKQRNDPRWCMALTVDVKPDSIKKNAKAFGFKTSRAGIPPTARPDGKV